jgi:hypothetical protein
MCDIPHKMTEEDGESPEDVREWLLHELSTTWPVALGSLSHRRAPCGKDNCSTCSSGDGHASWVLYGKAGGRRHSIYVRPEHVDDIAAAIDSGHRLVDLLHEAGRRYARAIQGRGEPRQPPEEAQPS